MLILVVGDIHADWGKLNALINDKSPDIVLQCGDFGYWPSMEVTKSTPYGKQNSWILNGVKPQKSIVYWCDGNHEEHPHLVQDALIHEMYQGVNFCSRGSVLRLPDGRNVLFIGGADSIDKDYRILGKDWFPEENISYPQFEMTMAIEDKIDIVISHTCPGAFNVHGSDGKYHDSNRIALDAILHKYKPDLWFFGHWHKYQQGIYNNTRWTCLDYLGHNSRAWVTLP